MTDPGAGIDIVIAESRPHQFLHQVGFFVGAAGRGNATDRITPIALLNLANTLCREGDCLAPGYLLPGLIDAVANHRRRDPIRVSSVAKSESAFDTGMATICLAAFVGHHAYNLIAFEFGLEGATNTAIGAGCQYAVFRYSSLDYRVFHQCRCRTGLHTGATCHTF